MNISQFFISRPVFAGVLSALILIGGLISIPQLPISEYPEVVPPTVVVRAVYPGANPKVIADTVAGPLEQGEGIVTSTLDMGEIVSGRIFQDQTGHYNRFDIFRLTVDRSERPPVQFGTGPGEAPPAEPAGG